MFEHRYEKPDANDLDFDGARAVVDAESRHIERWRGRPAIMGLALSGGGIRSASYGLGVLQALANAKLLDKFDYMSSVSGGGYIGASISYHLYQSSRPAHERAAGTPWPRFDATRQNFPYLSNPMVKSPLADDPETAAHKGELLRSLRENAKYLKSAKDITLLSLAGVAVRNTVVSLIVHLALLVLLLQAAFFFYATPLPDHAVSAPWELFVVAAVLGGFGLVSAGYVLASSGFEHQSDSVSYGLRRCFDRSAHWALLVGLVLLSLGALPYVDDWLSKAPLAKDLPWWLAWAMPKDAPQVGVSSALLGLLGNFWAYLQTGSKAKPKIATATLVSVASGVLLFGVLLVLFHFIALNNLHMANPDGFDGFKLDKALVLMIAALMFLIFGVLPDVNYVSMHRYYRDRLMETFMPDLGKWPLGRQWRSKRSDAGNETLLGKICGANMAHASSC